jgi:hypothetical protein
MRGRKLFPGVAAFVLAAFFFSHHALRGEEDPYPTGPEAGQKLAAELRAIKPDMGTNWHGVIKIFGREKKIPPVPVECRVIAGETNWTETFETSPADTNAAEKFMIIFSASGANKYFYARAGKPGERLGETMEISPAQADIPLGGSDFWLSDMGLEFLHWPEQDRLKGEMRSGRPCYLLISSNPHPAPGGYSRVKTWVEKKSGQPLEAEAYGAARTNHIVKSFSLEKVAQDKNGQYQVKEMDINGEGKFWSRLEIDTGDSARK